MTTKRLEIAAYLSIVIVCAMTASILVWRFVVSPGSSRPLANAPVGFNVRLPQVDWALGQRTAVLAMSTQCHFCTESAPFFKDLIKTAHGRGIRVIAVLPENREDGKRYLSKLNLLVDDVISAPLNRVGVTGTPTVLVVGPTGLVVDGWVGAISPDQQRKALKKL